MNALIDGVPAAGQQLRNKDTQAAVRGIVDLLMEGIGQQLRSANGRAPGIGQDGNTPLDLDRVPVPIGRPSGAVCLPAALAPSRPGAVLVENSGGTVRDLHAGASCGICRSPPSTPNPRTNMRYDWTPNNLDRHPNYIPAAYMA